MRISDWSQTCALPIFSVTEEIAVDLEQWARRAGSIRLLVAGSFHHRDREPSGRRSNRALAWVRGHAAPLSHDKHSPADRPRSEARRVGNECVSTSRSRSSPYHSHKKHANTSSI